MAENEELNSGFEEEKDFVEEEDKQVEVIENLEDPDELDEAMKIIEEELDELDAPEKDTATGSETSEEPDEPVQLDKEKDTSKEKGKPDDELADESEEAKAERLKLEAEEEAKNDFEITEEFIAEQPEESKATLTKYLGKSKSELVKAAAHAIAMKNPYLKDKDKVIEAIAEDIQSGTKEQIITTLMESTSEIGKPLEEGKTTPDEKDEGEGFTIPDELPPLPEDEKVKAALSTELVKELKNKYPDMPQDLNSPEFTEWRRDLEDDNPDNDFKDDMKEIQSNMELNAKRMFFLQDNYRNINNNLLVKEVEGIKQILKDKFNIENPEDIGVELKMVKDEKGSLFNKTLNGLMLKGNEADEDLIKFYGNIPLIKKGQLIKKFMYEHNTEILSYITNNSNDSTKKTIEQIKNNNLNVLGGKETSGQTQKTIKTVDEMSKIDDSEQLKVEMQKIEDSL